MRSRVTAKPLDVRASIEINLAEGEGFEPPEALPPQRFSRSHLGTSLGPWRYLRTRRGSAWGLLGGWAWVVERHRVAVRHTAKGRRRSSSRGTVRYAQVVAGERGRQPTVLVGRPLTDGYVVRHRCGAPIGALRFSGRDLRMVRGFEFDHGWSGATGVWQWTSHSAYAHKKLGWKTSNRDHTKGGRSLGTRHFVALDADDAPTRVPAWCANCRAPMTLDFTDLRAEAIRRGLEWERRHAEEARDSGEHSRSRELPF